MNNLSKYVASAGLAAMIGCNSYVPADQGNSDLIECQQTLESMTNEGFMASFNTNVMRPYGANLSAVTPLDQCLSYVAGVQLVNPESKDMTIGDGPVVMLGEEDVTTAYRDLVITEAAQRGDVTSYLADKDWATEYVQGPIDAWVCEHGAEVAHPDPEHPETRKIMYRSVWLTGNRQPRISLPRSMAALVKDKYQVENTSDAVETVMNTLGWENQPGYSVNIETDCKENTQ